MLRQGHAAPAIEVQAEKKTKNMQSEIFCRYDGY